MFYALISSNRTRFFVESLKMYMLPTPEKDSGLPKLMYCVAANGSWLYSLSCVVT